MSRELSSGPAFQTLREIVERSGHKHASAPHRVGDSCRFLSHAAFFAACEKILEEMKNCIILISFGAPEGWPSDELEGWYACAYFPGRSEPVLVVRQTGEYVFCFSRLHFDADKSDQGIHSLNHYEFSRSTPATFIIHLRSECERINTLVAARPPEPFVANLGGRSREIECHVTINASSNVHRLKQYAHILVNAARSVNVRYMVLEIRLFMARDGVWAASTEFYGAAPFDSEAFLGREFIAHTNLQDFMAYVAGRFYAVGKAVVEYAASRRPGLKGKDS